jgi:hypothetical protein
MPPSSRRCRLSQLVLPQARLEDAASPVALPLDQGLAKPGAWIHNVAPPRVDSSGPPTYISVAIGSPEDFHHEPAARHHPDPPDTL